MIAFCNVNMYASALMFLLAQYYQGAFPVWGGMFFILAAMPVIARVRGWL